MALHCMPNDITYRRATEVALQLGKVGVDHRGGSVASVFNAKGAMSGVGSSV